MCCVELFDVSRRAVIWCDWCDARWRDVMWHHVMWRGVTRRDVTWGDVMWRDVTWCRDVMWCGMAWRDVTWRDVMWRDVTAEEQLYSHSTTPIYTIIIPILCSYDVHPPLPSLQPEDYSERPRFGPLPSFVVMMSIFPTYFPPVPFVRFGTCWKSELLTLTRTKQITPLALLLKRSKDGVDTATWCKASTLAQSWETTDLSLSPSTFDKKTHTYVL